jgi:hypothetical protein
MSDSSTEVLAPTPAEPTPVRDLDVELEGASQAVLDAIAAWLCVTWEQPILRAMSSNAGRALDNADTFPALRAALVGLQNEAASTVEAAVAPLLDAETPIRDQALISSIDAVVLELVGLIGLPLRDAGFDPLSGGLERIQDGFRLKTMTSHPEITAAVDASNALRAVRGADRAEASERDRENARAEVERRWAATAP